MRAVIWLSLILIISSRPVPALECVPAVEVFPIQTYSAKDWEKAQGELGMYARVSPDGRFVLRSISAEGYSTVTLAELIRDKDKNRVEVRNTPLRNEAFPVFGSWRYVVNTNGDHYLFKDLYHLKNAAQPQFRGGISGFYAVAAEMPGGDEKSHQIRSMSWPDGEGGGELRNMSLQIQVDPSKSARIVDSSHRISMCSNIQHSEGWAMSLPMISNDGSEFSAAPLQPKNSRSSLRIYGLSPNGKDCELLEDLKISGSKLIFDYPREDKKQASVALLSTSSDGRSGIYFYDRDLKRFFLLNDPSQGFFPDQYPGFTRDGRILYGARWRLPCTLPEKECPISVGYIIADPYQSKDFRNFKMLNPEQGKSLKHCILKSQVKSSEEFQRQIWGLN